MSRGEIDSWTVERNGIRYRVDIDPDYESNANPAGMGDCYSPSDLDAHARYSWGFVGVTVTPEVSGTDHADRYPSAQASLWGVEWGVMPAETEPHEGGMHPETTLDRAAITEYPVPDLISEARDSLRTLRDRLNALNLEDEK